MAEVTAADVKALRESTGAGMMDCKKALQETGADMEAATDWLRKKGLSKAAKKSDRAAAEGLVAIAFSADGRQGVAVEVNSETDFVARNETFQAAVKDIAQAGLVADSVEALTSAKLASGETSQERLTNLIATIGENMTLRRFAKLSVQNGVVAGYVHNAVADGLGKIAVLVALEGEGDRATLNDVGRKVAMHVAASAPLARDIDELDPAVVAKERTLFADQARASGKPENIIEKMVEGRLRKFYEESVLLKQAFVMDPDKSVEAMVNDATGGKARVTAFVRLVLGEGVEKKQEDFAAEVAAMSGKGS